MPVTLADIAKIAHVTESSVSRALQDNPRISVETRERIKKIAADLDFEYNAHARSLSTHKSWTVGVILSNFGTQVCHTYYLDLLVNDLRFQLASRNYDLLICDSEHHDTGDSNLSRLVRQRKVDGLILIIAELPEKDRKVIERQNIPIVLVNSRSVLMQGESIENLPSFFTDNIYGSSLAARHLIENDCRNLLCLADLNRSPEMLERREGFVQETERSGVKADIIECPSDYTGALSFIQDHLADIRRHDGVFCHTDVMACALLQACAAEGISVPGELKVIGYDDIELGTYFSPLLTTIHQPREEIAERAVSYLMNRLNSGDQSPKASSLVQVCIPPRLVSRKSV
ncbi:MAG: LacI family DNA-binding transcriptional regulator [Spirochaetales bacterium]|nr:LacI family DNA-binding transcriptional regulator [Spirochaetales bacterium]